MSVKHFILIYIKHKSAMYFGVTRFTYNMYSCHLGRNQIFSTGLCFFLYPFLLARFFNKKYPLIDWRVGERCPQLG